MSSRITITSEQRDILYHPIWLRLAAANDLWMLIETEQFDEANRLGRRLSDDLRVVVEDLGWGPEGSGKAVELKTPPDILRRVLSLHCQEALKNEANDAAERREMDEVGEQNRTLLRTSQRLLAELNFTRDSTS